MRIAGALGLQLFPIARNFWNQAKAKINSQRRPEFDVKVDANVTPASASINRFRQQQQANAVNLNATVGTSRASLQMSLFRRRQELNPLTLQLAIDQDSIRESREKILRVENTWKQSDIKRAIRVQVFVAGAVSLPALAQGIVSLSAAITDLTRVSLLVPGALSGIAAAVATTTTGLSGMGDALKEANQGLKDAERNAREYRRASLDLEKAQRGVVDAIKAANRELEDQNSRLERGRLGVEQARLNVQRANQRLLEGGFKNFVEYQQALLDVKQANLDLSDAVKRSSRDIQDFYENSARTANGTDGVKDALLGLSDAAHEYRKAQFEALGMSEKFIESMRHLSPAAQDFVLQMAKLPASFRGLRDSVQTTFISGIGDAITDLANRQLPMLKRGMEQVALGLNTSIKQAISSLGTQENSDAIGKIFQRTGQALEALRPGINSLTNAFVQLSEVGSRFLPRLSLAFNSVMERFESFISRAESDGSLEKWIDRGLKLVSSLGRSLSSIASIFNSVTEAYEKATGNIGGFASTMERGLAGIAKYLASPSGQAAMISWIRTSQEFMQTIKESLPGIRQIFGVLGDAAREFAEIAFPIFAEIGQFLDDHSTMVKGLIQAYLGFRTIKPIMSTLGKGWREATSAMSGYRDRLKAVAAEQQAAEAKLMVARSKAADAAARQINSSLWGPRQRAAALQARNAAVQLRGSAMADLAVAKQMVTVTRQRITSYQQLGASTKQITTAIGQHKQALATWAQAQTKANAAQAGAIRAAKDYRRTVIAVDKEAVASKSGLIIAQDNVRRSQGRLDAAVRASASERGPWNKLKRVIGAGRTGGVGGAMGALMGIMGRAKALIGSAVVTGSMIYALDQLTAAHQRAADAANNQAEAEEALSNTLARGSGSATAATLEENVRQLRNRPNPYSPDDRGQDFDALAILNQQLGISVPEAARLALPTEVGERERRLAPADAEIIAAVPGLQEWQQWGDRYKQNGVDETVYGKALNGDKPSIAKVEAARRAILDSNRLSAGMPLGLGVATGFAPNDLGAAQQQLPQTGAGGGLRGLSLGAGALRGVGDDSAAAGAQIQRDNPIEQPGLNRRGNREFSQFGLGAAGARLMPDGSAVVELDRYPSNRWIEENRDNGISVERRYPNGAIVTIDPDYAPGYFNRYATGGPVWGAGTATSDSIPAMLSNGEFVINARSASIIGHDKLSKLNSVGGMSGGPRKPGHFAPGGPVFGDSEGDNIWTHAWRGAIEVWEWLRGGGEGEPALPTYSYDGSDIDTSPVTKPLPGPLSGPAAGAPGVPLGPSGAIYIPRLGGSGALPDTQSANGVIGTIASASPNAPVNSDAHILDYLVQVGNAWGFPIGSGPPDTEAGRRLAEELGIPTHFVDMGQHSVNRAIDYGNTDLARSGKLTEFVKDWISDPEKVAATRQLIFQDPKTGEAFAIYGGKVYTGQAAMDIYGKDFPDHQSHIHLALEGVPNSVFTGSGSTRPQGGGRQRGIGIGSAPYGSFADVFGQPPNAPQTPKLPTPAAPSAPSAPPAPLDIPTPAGTAPAPVPGPMGQFSQPMDIITQIGLEILKAIFGFFGIDISGIIDAVMGFTRQNSPFSPQQGTGIEDVPQPDPDVLAGLDAAVAQYEAEGNFTDAEAVKQAREEYLKRFNDASSKASMEAAAAYYESIGELELAAKIRASANQIDVETPIEAPSVETTPTWPSSPAGPVATGDPWNPAEPGVGGKSSDSQTPPTWGLKPPSGPARLGTWPGMSTSAGSGPAWLSRLSEVQQLNQTAGWTNKGSRGDTSPTLFLIHTSGPTDTGAPGADGQALVDYMAKNNVSYNYVIDKNGQIVRTLVPPSEASWASANLNQQSINAVIGGSSSDWTREEWISEAGEAIKTLAAIAARDTAQFGIPASMPEKGKPGAGIGGHDYASSVPGSGTDHMDPGKFFPWDLFWGYVNQYRAGYASGGYVSGPGGPTSDSIPAMLSDGEFVINAKAVKHWGIDQLERMNAAPLSFNEGGSVTSWEARNKRLGDAARWLWNTVTSIPKSVLDFTTSDELWHGKEPSASPEQQEVLERLFQAGAIDSPELVERRHIGPFIPANPNAPWAWNTRGIDEWKGRFDPRPSIITLFNQLGAGVSSTGQEETPEFNPGPIKGYEEGGLIGSAGSGKKLPWMPEGTPTGIGSAGTGYNKPIPKSIYNPEVPGMYASKAPAGKDRSGNYLPRNAYEENQNEAAGFIDNITSGSWWLSKLGIDTSTEKWNNKWAYIFGLSEFQQGLGWLMSGEQQSPLMSNRDLVDIFQLGNLYQFSRAVGDSNAGVRERIAGAIGMAGFLPIPFGNRPNLPMGGRPKAKPFDAANKNFAEVFPLLDEQGIANNWREIQESVTIYPDNRLEERIRSTPGFTGQIGPAQGPIAPIGAGSQGVQDLLRIYGAESTRGPLRGGDADAFHGHADFFPPAIRRALEQWSGPADVNRALRDFDRSSYRSLLDLSEQDAIMLFYHAALLDKGMEMAPRVPQDFLVTRTGTPEMLGLDEQLSEAIRRGDSQMISDLLDPIIGSAYPITDPGYMAGHVGAGYDTPMDTPMGRKIGMVFPIPKGGRGILLSHPRAPLSRAGAGEYEFLGPRGGSYNPFNWAFADPENPSAGIWVFADYSQELRTPPIPGIKYPDFQGLNEMAKFSELAKKLGFEPEQFAEILGIPFPGKPVPSFDLGSLNLGDLDADLPPVAEKPTWDTATAVGSGDSLMDKYDEIAKNFMDGIAEKKPGTLGNPTSNVGNLGSFIPDDLAFEEPWYKFVTEALASAGKYQSDFGVQQGKFPTKLKVSDTIFGELVEAYTTKLDSDQSFYGNPLHWVSFKPDIGGPVHFGPTHLWKNSPAAIEAAMSWVTGSRDALQQLSDVQQAILLDDFAKNNFTFMTPETMSMMNIATGSDSFMDSARLFGELSRGMDAAIIKDEFPPAPTNVFDPDGNFSQEFLNTYGLGADLMGSFAGDFADKIIATIVRDIYKPDAPGATFLGRSGVWWHQLLVKRYQSQSPTLGMGQEWWDAKVSELTNNFESANQATFDMNQALSPEFQFAQSMGGPGLALNRAERLMLNLINSPAMSGGFGMTDFAGIVDKPLSEMSFDALGPLEFDLLSTLFPRISRITNFPKKGDLTKQDLANFVTDAELDLLDSFDLSRIEEALGINTLGYGKKNPSGGSIDTDVDKMSMGVYTKYHKDPEFQQWFDNIAEYIKSGEMPTIGKLYEDAQKTKELFEKFKEDKALLEGAITQIEKMGYPGLSVSGTSYGKARLSVSGMSGNKLASLMDDFESDIFTGFSPFDSDYWDVQSWLQLQVFFPAAYKKIMAGLVSEDAAASIAQILEGNRPSQWVPTAKNNGIGFWEGQELLWGVPGLANIFADDYKPQLPDPMLVGAPMSQLGIKGTEAWYNTWATVTGFRHPDDPTPPDPTPNIGFFGSQPPDLPLVGLESKIDAYNKYQKRLEESVALDKPFLTKVSPADFQRLYHGLPHPEALDQFDLDQIIFLSNSLKDFESTVGVYQPGVISPAMAKSWWQKRTETWAQEAGPFNDGLSLQGTVQKVLGAIGFRSGGFVSGPGTSTSDSIPALLSDGEFVMNAKAVKMLGADRLSAMNSEPQRFADGGMVGNIPLLSSLLEPIPQQIQPSPLPEPGGAPGGSGGTGLDINTPEGQQAYDENFPPERVEALADVIGGLTSYALAPKQFGSGSAGAAPGESKDPRAKIAPAPTGRQHAHPALTGSIKGAFNTIGSLASTAVQAGVAAAVAGGSFGAAAPLAGQAAGAAGSLINAGTQIAGDVAAGAANVISSFLVGTVTPSQTGQGYGAPLLPRQQTQPVNNFQSVHNGNIMTNNLSEYSRLKDRKDAQKAAPFFNRAGA